MVTGRANSGSGIATASIGRSYSMRTPGSRLVAAGQPEDEHSTCTQAGSQSGPAAARITSSMKERVYCSAGWFPDQSRTSQTRRRQNQAMEPSSVSPSWFMGIWRT
jgi:hypothetical protein